MTNGNGSPSEAAPPPQLNVLAQYTKDLSFENPNAPASLAPQQQQPAINIQINVSANNIAENEYEVTLSVEGKAENAGKLMFSFDLAYAGVFRIVNVPKENLHPLVMIECPRLLFPFAREIIATAAPRSGRYRLRPKARRRARRRAWCGGNCRSHSASRDHRDGSTRRDACAAPTATCPPAVPAQSAAV